MRDQPKSLSQAPQVSANLRLANQMSLRISVQLPRQGHDSMGANPCSARAFTSTETHLTSGKRLAGTDEKTRTSTRLPQHDSGGGSTPCLCAQTHRGTKKHHRPDAEADSTPDRQPRSVSPQATSHRNTDGMGVRERSAPHGQQWQQEHKQSSRTTGLSYKAHKQNKSASRKPAPSPRSSFKPAELDAKRGNKVVLQTRSARRRAKMKAKKETPGRREEVSTAGLQSIQSSELVTHRPHSLLAKAYTGGQVLDSDGDAIPDLISSEAERCDSDTSESEGASTPSLVKTTANPLPLGPFSELSTQALMDRWVDEIKAEYPSQLFSLCPTPKAPAALQPKDRDMSSLTAREKTVISMLKPMGPHAYNLSPGRRGFTSVPACAPTHALTPEPRSSPVLQLGGHNWALLRNVRTSAPSHTNVAESTDPQVHV